MSDIGKAAKGDNKENGAELRDNNEKIVRLMSLLKQQRDEMSFLIQKQQEEKSKIQTEIERLTFKLSLLTKSLNQRLKAKANYDRTVKDIDENYLNLVEESGKLLSCLTKEVQDLEEIMDKKTSTGGSQDKVIRPSSKNYTTPETTSEPEDTSPTEEERQQQEKSEQSSRRSSSRSQTLQQEQEKNEESRRRSSASQNENRSLQEEKTEQTSKRSSGSQNDNRSSLSSTRRSSGARSEDRPHSIGSGRSSDRRSSTDERQNSQERKQSESSEQSKRSSFDEKIREMKGTLEQRQESGEKRRLSMERKAQKSLEDIVETGTERKKSSDDYRPYRDLLDNTAKNDTPPPIISTKLNEDIEIQSYREAYGRQHNINGNNTPPRKLSASRQSRRTSD